ncbi:hypothetical protein QUF72_11560 [Desulfobacterales bacterium HSG2]|nr:hypothetical protein [Desulfobacterales bacterium HSG2]
MKTVSSDNFVRIFSQFENRLNAVFQRKTEILRGGNVRDPKNASCYEYVKKLVTKDDVTLDINVLYDKIEDDYLYYSYNIFFENNKLMFHYEPSHKEHFQPISMCIWVERNCGMPEAMAFTFFLTNIIHLKFLRCSKGTLHSAFQRTSAFSRGIDSPANWGNAQKTGIRTERLKFSQPTLRSENPVACNFFFRSYAVLNGLQETDRQKILDNGFYPCQTRF